MVQLAVYGVELDWCSSDETGEVVRDPGEGFRRGAHHTRLGRAGRGASLPRDEPLARAGMEGYVLYTCSGRVGRVPWNRFR